MPTIKYPSGAVSTSTLSATGTQAITITNQLTLIDGVTTIATGNRTIDLTISAEVKAGAIVWVESKTTATETTIFGTGIDGITFTGVAGKTLVKAFIYNGTAFKSMGATEQID
jgi:hypothetical protein